MTGLILTLGLVATSANAAGPAGGQACGDCHGAAFAGWRASAHAAAATNPIYRAGLRVEPRQFCVDCHTSTGARAEEGIGCASCHAARAATAERWRRRAVTRWLCARAPTFAIRRSARDCHEFATPAFEGGTMRMTDLPMQRTYSEWLAYRAAGGRETCQSCHMPGGDHTMRGAHDVELLRGSSP